jgi:hypothetical protein
MELLGRFAAAFGMGVADASGGPPTDARLRSTPGFDGLSQLCGRRFRRGLYRLHDAVGEASAKEAIDETFPLDTHRFAPFGCDWLGRQFALDASNPGTVALLDPGAGEILEVQADLLDFHNSELVDHSDAALASDFFEAWQATQRAPADLVAGQCVGYRLPLFLGGADEVENLERADIAVYWSMCAQLWHRVNRIPHGGPVGRVDIAE